MALRLRRFLHCSAANRIQPCLGGLLTAHFRTRPIPTVIGRVGQGCAAALLYDGIDSGFGVVQQPHLRHTGDVGTLSVFPDVKDLFRQGRMNFCCAIEGEGVCIAVVCRQVSRRALAHPDTIGECHRVDVPQIDGIAVALNVLVVIDVEHHGNGLLTLRLTVRQRHHLAVRAKP